jgi:hypothetical protein
MRRPETIALLGTREPAERGELTVLLPARVHSMLGGQVSGMVVGPGPTPVDELVERTCALALGETGGSG